MQWFKVPEKIYFEAGSIAYLEKMPDIERAFIVTDQGMVKLGYVDKVLYHLRNRQKYVHSEIFSDVEPDPSFDTIKKGVEQMNNLYDLMLMQMAKKANKKTYIELYNYEYLARLKKKEDEFEEEVKKLNLIGKVINPVYIFLWKMMMRVII